MFDKKTGWLFLALLFFVVGTGFGQTLEDNWNDLLHYIVIGRLDLAKGYAQAIVQSPDIEQLHALSKQTPQYYSILMQVYESSPDKELAELCGKILGLVERSRFVHRADPLNIDAEIKRLSTTARGRLAAAQRLQNAGEYAIMYMLDAMADKSRRDELPNIVWALGQMGRDSVRPLVAALQTQDVGLKAEIIKALGAIRYPESLPYLKYVVEKDSSSELRSLANASINEIEPDVLNMNAATLFYQLAGKYYYHTASLQPVQDVNSANMWFWDFTERRLAFEKVDRIYFNELMAMRNCEWGLKADPGFGWSIGLWLAAYFKAEAYGIDMPPYFGEGHADSYVYATTAGPTYLHQALALAVRDRNPDVALAAVEALVTTAGEKSLFFQVGKSQPLVQALSFDDRAVRYSAAIAIGSANPMQDFAESQLVAANLAQALAQHLAPEQEGMNAWEKELSESYALRAARVMLKLAQSRNRVVDLSLAQKTLITGIRSRNPEIQVLVGRILAHLENPTAQRAIAAMALTSKNSLEVRIEAFGSLAESAKLNANQLTDEMIGYIYNLISSDDTEPALRSAASTAFGALNLPSIKVKDLILDQARS